MSARSFVRYSVSVLTRKAYCLGGAPDLSNLGAALADDAPDDLVGDGHLVGLLGARAPGLARTSQQGQGCNRARLGCCDV